MAIIDRLWLVSLTRNKNDAGVEPGRMSDKFFNVTVNVDGIDVVDDDIWVDMPRGEGAISPVVSSTVEPPPDFGHNVGPFESSALTNSSIRLGTREDDNWDPQHVLLLGRTERRVLALAMETDLTLSLSTDRGEGHLSMPLRLVKQGTSSTVIRRVLFAAYTRHFSDAQTDSDIQLEITAGGNTALLRTVPDTPQSDFESNSANWYYLDVQTPFTRSEVLSNGGIKLRILGHDQWWPGMVFVYGLDTVSGRPNEVVHLSSIPDWTLGKLSTDPSEGAEFVDLPVV